MSVPIRNFSHAYPPEGLRVMTYNTLAQQMLKPHRYPTNGSAIIWSNRLSWLSEEITAYCPDVLCMQEIDAKRMPDWERLFENLGMTARWFQYPQKGHGIVIASKSDRLELVDQVRINYRDTDRLPIQDPKSNHQGLCLVFQLKPPKTKFVMATTHLTWRPECCYERFRQFLTLVEEIKLLQTKWDTSHAIIAGDFNSSPHTPTHGFVIDKHLSPAVKNKLEISLEKRGLLNESSAESALEQMASLAAKSNGMFRSCYYETYGCEPAFTNWTQSYRDTLDYIFVTANFKIEAVLELPSKEDMGPEPSSLPRVRNGLACPSDHLPIMAILNFAKPTGELSEDLMKNLSLE